MLPALDRSVQPLWIWGVEGVILTVHDITGIAFVPLIIGHLVLNRRRLAAKLRAPTVERCRGLSTKPVRPRCNLSREGSVRTEWMRFLRR